MSRIPVVLVSGLHLPLARIALGGRFGEIDEGLAHDLLDLFASLGGNTIDTAHNYASGASELAIGRWLHRRRNRHRIIVVDKGCYPDATLRSRVSPEALRQDLYESLDRLQSDYIDLYLLHRDDEGTEVGLLLDVLNDEMACGRIRAFGASNWTCSRLGQANRYAMEHGLVGFAASSCGLSLAEPKEPIWPGTIFLDNESRVWYEARQMPLLAWSSQARGWFSGRYETEQFHDELIARVYGSSENIARLHRSRQLARRRGATPVQIALAYVLSQPFPVVALVGPETPSELEESWSAYALELSAGEIAFLEGRCRDIDAC